MKKKIILSSLLALGVLGGVVGLAHRPSKVEAANVAAGTHVYFELPSTWSSDGVNILIGHDSWSTGIKMNKITNTDIYYVSMPTWDGYNKFAFINVSGAWGDEGSSVDSRKNWAPNKTNSIANPLLSGSDKYNIFGGDALNPYAENVSSKDGLNKTITVSANEGEGGIVTVEGYELTSASSVTQKSGSSVNILKYTDAKLTATVNDGYEFVGWYDSETDGKLLSTDLIHTIKDIYEAKTYYARYNKVEAVPSTPDELFTEYYNNGTYVKETVLNTNEIADEDVKDYFHAGAQVKYRQTTYTPGQLSMVTKATSEAEWGTHTSTYKDNGNGGVDHLTDGVKDYSVSGIVNGQDRSSVENWYVTLHDFVNTELNGWEYEDGVYTLSLLDNVLATKMAREFVAPLWLETEEAKNYVQFDKLTVEEVGESLVMKLYVDSTNSGQLVEGANLVFSQATITK